MAPERLGDEVHEGTALPASRPQARVLLEEHREQLKTLQEAATRVATQKT